MKITTVRSRPIFTWEATEPRQCDDRALKEAASLRDCARRSVELAGRCTDPDITGLLFEVADELQRDADYIENGTTGFGAPDDGYLSAERLVLDRTISNDPEPHACLVPRPMKP